MACSPSSAIPDGGDDDGGADADTSFSYTPQGCSYTVTLPAARGFQNVGLDDGAAVTDVPGATPVRVRIGLGGGASGADARTSAVFTWETSGQNNTAEVKIGANVYKGHVWTTPPPTVGIGTDEPPVYMHEVHVCGLTAGTTYPYQVGGGAAGADVWSPSASFATLPGTGAITLGVSGDSRDSSSIFQMVQQRFHDAGVAMQLFSGDFVLWGSQASLYQTWLGAASPTLGTQIILPVAGNHENSSSQFYGNFALPGDDGPYAEQFFSVDIGSAHIVMFDDQELSTEPTIDESQAVLKFIDDDLTKAEANRANVPFLIAVHHRAEFGNGVHSTDGDEIQARASLNPIWDKHHVDLVINGHEHNYERSKPITGPATAPVVQTDTTKGTTYVVCAGAGASSESSKGATTYDATQVSFDGSSPYVGVYATLGLDAHTLTWTAYGLQA
ncbi:MAG TPA: metallophosphoesterase family protein, partial [Polyangiaceae bacterium]